MEEEEREKFWWDDNGAEMTFVENMRMLRERRGMSQTEFAKRASQAGLSFHQPTVQRIESGQRPLKLTESIQIANILGSTLEQMMNDVSLPFSYRMLAEQVSWDELKGKFGMFSGYRGMSWEVTQIEEHLEDYKKAAASFGEEPLPGVIERVEFVVERLRWVQEHVEKFQNSVDDIAAEISELDPLPKGAHGGTPWDDEES